MVQLMRTMELKNKTILVIDDSTTNVVLLEAIFIEKGYNIEKALNAKDAFYIIEKNIPDLILLDLLMPRYNGFDFLKEIKSIEKTSKIPIVVISAITDNENIKKSMELGASFFIKKPVDIPHLVNIAEKILN